MEIFIIGLLSGSAFGMVLFLIAMGLSLTFGVMGIVNLAHGAIFMAGLYIGITVAKSTGNFILGVLAGAIASGIVGLVIERAFLRQLYKQVLEQILVTFGFVYIIVNSILWIWGPWPKAPFVPLLLSGSIPIGEFQFPIYRLAVIVIGLLMCLGLWWLQDKTRVGAIIRAGMDNAEITAAFGINLKPVTAGTFFFGSFIAGLSAVIGLPLLGGLFPTSSLDIFLLALAVCIIGGTGSVQGALAGALLTGIVITFGTIYFPEIAMFLMYLLMVIVLLFRPHGLLGRKI